MKILRSLIPFFVLAVTPCGAFAYYISGDLTVHSSACIGHDCSDPETYGFDTLKLKENNIRLRFDDTSTAASFPSNDWYLVVNDSSDGGQSYFSIEDATAGRRVFTVEAGARSNSLYVDDGGHLGLGTSTPSAEIHSVYGDTPTLRLDQDGSSGWTPQIWDVSGNESNFFIRDVTHASRLPFRIKPSAPTNSIYVDSDGDLGFGTASPTGHLELARTGLGYTYFRITQTGNTVPSADMTLTSGATQTGGSGSYRINLVDGDGYEMEIDDQGRLTVRGGYYVNTTALNVPDYVFSEDYNLRPLDEVQEFIADKGHLPEMPSAQEIEKSGLNMTDMQMRLLQKIEELTLYTLEQERAIQKLKEQENTIVQLKQEIALLKAAKQ
jgi:hypothetical protein